MRGSLHLKSFFIKEMIGKLSSREKLWLYIKITKHILNFHPHKKSSELTISYLLRLLTEKLCGMSEPKRFAGRQSLVTSYQSLVTSYQSLFTSYQLLVTSHQLLATSHQLLVTSHQLLVTSYQSLVTSHQLLATSYQSLVTSQLLLMSSQLILVISSQLLTSVIYELNFLFKMRFIRVSRRKKLRRFLPCGAFLSRAVDDCLSNDCVSSVYSCYYFSNTKEALSYCVSMSYL